MSSKSGSGARLHFFALLLIAVWLPLDTETGFVERVRGAYAIGDAMAPAFAGLVFALAGVLMLIRPMPEDAPRLDRSHLAFLGMLLGLACLGLLLMRWAGPAATAMMNADDYRLLRDTVPWKYIGFATGGFLITTGLVAIIERRLGRNAVLTGVFAVIVIIAIYDLPFDDLLLPPNGDV